VLSTLSSRGRTEPWAPLVVLWAVMTGAVASVLLTVDGLQALQTFTILAATPFVLILIGLCFALYADLRRDPLRERRVGPVRGHVPGAANPPPERRPEAPAGRNGAGAPQPASLTTGENGGRQVPRPAGASIEVRRDQAASGD
jgi:choline-glycine betaine transporter